MLATGPITFAQIHIPGSSYTLLSKAIRRKGMCGSIGSKSAQTPSESSQESSSSGAAATEVAGHLNGLGAGNYHVVHIWKPTAPGSPAHHSQIQIRTTGDVPLFHFGLFNDDGKAVIMGGPGAAHSGSGYTLSTSYKPNPMAVSKAQIEAAYQRALDSCGTKYGLLTNNCQKFGRKFMTALGSSHHRKMFHM
jgi:hypothetical protein